MFLYWFLHLFNRFWVKKFEFSLYFAARLNKYWILHYFFKFSRNILVSFIISLKISNNSRFVQSCQLNHVENSNMIERELNEFLLTQLYCRYMEILCVHVVQATFNFLWKIFWYFVLWLTRKFRVEFLYKCLYPTCFNFVRSPYAVFSRSPQYKFSVFWLKLTDFWESDSFTGFFQSRRHTKTLRCS